MTLKSIGFMASALVAFGLTTAGAGALSLPNQMPRTPCFVGALGSPKMCAPSTISTFIRSVGRGQAPVPAPGPSIVPIVTPQPPATGGTVGTGGVTPGVSAVPVPFSGVLLLGAIAGFGLLRRKSA